MLPALQNEVSCSEMINTVVNNVEYKLLSSLDRQTMIKMEEQSLSVHRVVNE